MSPSSDSHKICIFGRRKECLLSLIMQQENRAGLDPKRFEGLVDGKEVKLYKISNQKGMEAYFINQGAKLVSLIVPTPEEDIDVVIGHDSLEEYLGSEEQYFGAICGRYANRIAKGHFELDGKSYQLAVNNGPNALHGGLKGYNAVVWDVVEELPNRLTLAYTSPDGEEGYPGTLHIKVSYLLNEENELVISYDADTDQKTILNLTNHAYFNLSGDGDVSVHDHLLRINAGHYLPTDETAIPYGKPEAVKGTPFDFTETHTIGERIDESLDQLVWARGYDHTYVLDRAIDGVDWAAEAISPKTNIRMRVFTDQPGVQLYTGNWMSGNMRGKHGHRYPARAAFCLETQHYPDSPNRPEYPSVVLDRGEHFHSETRFVFDVVK